MLNQEILMEDAMINTSLSLALELEDEKKGLEWGRIQNLVREVEELVFLTTGRRVCARPCGRK